MENFWKNLLALVIFGVITLIITALYIGILGLNVDSDGFLLYWAIISGVMILLFGIDY